MSVGNRLRALYDDARRRDPTIWTDPIQLPDAKIRDVVAAVQDVALIAMDVDALGGAFESFFSTIFRGGLGQYFTRRELVRFVVAVVAPDETDFVLDPAAGSGGFLLEVLLQVWSTIDRKYAGRADVERLKTDFALEHLFGIELHAVAARVCQTNLLVHHDGHTNIEVERSCLDRDFANRDISLGRFSVVVGNPPFGDQVREGDTDRLGSARLTDFELPATGQIESEIVILERSLKFLSPGGRLGMVVPDGLLNNSGEASRCPAFRRFLIRNARVTAIVSLPDFAFRKAGAQNKTSLLFCRRHTAEERAALDAELHAALQERDSVAARAHEYSTEQDEALLDALRRHDYRVFLGEAEKIGYGPAGGPTSENELYGLRGFVPDRTLLTTLLGQFEAFERDPDSFVGAESPACMALLASEMFGSHVSRRMDPKYHLFKHREAVAAVPSGMRRYTLGEVLVRRREAVVPAETPDETFVTLTLTQEGRLEPREAGKGNNPIDWQGAYFEPGARWFRAETDDLIISRIDVWKGCVAVIPEEYSGAIVTTEFPLYEVRRELLRPVYLKLLLRTGYFQKAMKAITTGHSNRRRTRGSRF